MQTSNPKICFLCQEVLGEECLDRNLPLLIWGWKTVVLQSKKCNWRGAQPLNRSSQSRSPTGTAVSISFIQMFHDLNSFPPKSTLILGVVSNNSKQMNLFIIFTGFPNQPLCIFQKTSSLISLHFCISHNTWSFMIPAGMRSVWLVLVAEQREKNAVIHVWMLSGFTPTSA